MFNKNKSSVEANYVRQVKIETKWGKLSLELKNEHRRTAENYVKGT